MDVRGWPCTVAISDGFVDMDLIDELLTEADASVAIRNRVRRNLQGDMTNSAFTYTNPERRMSVMYIGTATSGREYMNSMLHEFRHLVDQMSHAYGFDLDGEDSAYLAGDIAYQMSDIMCRYACDRCNHRETWRTDSHSHTPSRI